MASLSGRHKASTFMVLPLLRHILLEGMANEILREKEITGVQTGRKETQLSLLHTSLSMETILKNLMKDTEAMRLFRSQDTRST